jgi:multiple sugar transport system permease protein
MGYSWFDRNLKWIYTLPALLFVGIMIVFPIFYTGRVSLYEWSMSSTVTPKWIGLDNYISLLKDERFWNSVKVTFYFSSASMIIEMVLGVAIAVLLNRKFRGKNIVKTIFMLPMVATPVAMGLVWLLIYEPSFGAANTLLKAIGLEPMLWLGSPSQVIPSLILIDVWQWTPMVTLIVLSGLSTLPTEPYEAADVDGAGNWRKFFSITLPLLKSTIIVTTMLRLIDVLKQFDIIYATTQGGPGVASETLNLFGYVLSFQYYNLGLASALLILFFILILILTMVIVWLNSRREKV